jgi:hypothetical protein
MTKETILHKIARECAGDPKEQSARIMQAIREAQSHRDRLIHDISALMGAFELAEAQAEVALLDAKIADEQPPGGSP